MFLQVLTAPELRCIRPMQAGQISRLPGCAHAREPSVAQF